MFVLLTFLYGESNLQPNEPPQKLRKEEPDSEPIDDGVLPVKIQPLNPILVQEAAVAKNIRLGQAGELSQDEIVNTLQEERRKILTEIYGFDPLEATFGDYDLGGVSTVQETEVEEVDEVDNVESDVDKVTVDKKFLRKLIRAQRIRRLRNRAQLFGIKNPYIALSIAGK